MRQDLTTPLKLICIISILSACNGRNSTEDCQSPSSNTSVENQCDSQLSIGASIEDPENGSAPVEISPPTTPNSTEDLTPDIADNAPTDASDNSNADNLSLELITTASPSNANSKFQLDDVLYTNNVYDGRQLDKNNNYALLYYDGIQDFVKWRVPAQLGDNSNPCIQSQANDTIYLHYRLTSKKDSVYERNTFVRSFPAMVVGTMGGRFESWGVECQNFNQLLPDTLREGGSPVFDMNLVSKETGFPVKAGDISPSVEISVKADISNNTAAHGITNVFLDSYWHDVSQVGLLPNMDPSLLNNLNGINGNVSKAWNLNIWFDWPKTEGNISSWTGGFKIGEVSFDTGGQFDVYFKIEGSRINNLPTCRMGDTDNCFLYIALVTQQPNAARDGITVDYSQIAQWMRSEHFRDMFLRGATEFDTASVKAYEAWRAIDGEHNDNLPDPAARGPRFPDADHVIGGLHLGSELWYNPEAQEAIVQFDTLGVKVDGWGEFGHFIDYK